MAMKYLMLTGKSQTQRVNTLWFQLYKLIEMTNTELWNI